MLVLILVFVCSILVMGLAQRATCRFRFGVLLDMSHAKGQFAKALAAGDRQGMVDAAKPFLSREHERVITRYHIISEISLTTAVCSGLVFIVLIIFFGIRG